MVVSFAVVRRQAAECHPRCPAKRHSQMSSYAHEPCVGSSKRPFSGWYCYCYCSLLLLLLRLLLLLPLSLGVIQG